MKNLRITISVFYEEWNLMEECNAYTDCTKIATIYVCGADLSGTMRGTGDGGLLAVKRDGAWYAPLNDANGHQKSAKPKAMPPGDRDFIAVPKGRSEERYPATQRQLYVSIYVSETGAVVAEYEYDAFGNTISQSGSLSDTFRHRFSTKPWIAALGVYDYGERLYSPVLRRWLSRDPIEENGGLNLYAICGNDAVNGVDPQGMFTVRAVSQSPRYSAESDFWFSIAFDFSENDHQAGAVWVTKSRKVDLYECGSNKKYKGLSDLSQITSVLVEGRIPRRRSREELVAFLFTDGKERGYVEVFSENKLKNVCGKIEYDIVVEYKKASPFVNGKSIQDKHRLKWYNFTPVSQGGNGDLRASYHVLLSYSCNRMDGPEADSESEKFLGVWGKRFPGMIDRVDDSRNTRAGTGSFPYFDSTD